MAGDLNNRAAQMEAQLEERVRKVSSSSSMLLSSLELSVRKVFATPLTSSISVYSGSPISPLYYSQAQS